ncbi:DUF4091 domain-containing protein [Sabulilitoribacter arenilitoris]|uniref:DUF4091 domain-containing protein n=1 Tax=Wocania arenilitoris TaxID=2044858 RepID=A0AAE3JL63_9FLAO|nr:DUF4091 domain-containing protein [Wocania arenilitoris]MCF7567847.1 DUF4091 domain-containing protein [Wocania arenilitoris]
MKPLIIRIIFLFISSSVFAQLWIVDPLEPVYPDKNELKRYSTKLEADIAEEGIAEAHVILKLPIGKLFTITASTNGKPLKNVWSALIDVPVEQNTGLDSRTEQYIDKINPYVIRRAPFRIFEVIKPLKKETLKVTTTYTALRLAIPSSNLNKKTNKIELVIKTDVLEYRGTFVVKVHQVKLPKLSKSKFFYTNWFNLTKMENQHNIKRWSNDWFIMLNKYAKLMAHGRQNSISLPNELFKYEGGELYLENEKMLRFINVFRENGFKYFESPHLMNRGENDDWGDPELKVALTKRRYYKEKGKKDITILMTQIYNFVKANNLENNWLQHISDEPTQVNAKCYKDVAKQVKSIFPEIKIMEATNDRDGLAGAVDIWCPLINDFQENESFFREREKHGEKVLVYTCLIPGGKWLNRTLDMEKLRQVYFGWGAAYYNTNGYLHWGLNQYYSDPFNQSVVHHPAPGSGVSNFLPAGDTHIVYPGKEGPLSSIRFEAHRIGIEDYELLQKLNKINKNKYTKLVNTLFKSYTDYNLSVEDYRKTKKKLLKALL